MKKRLQAAALAAMMCSSIFCIFPYDTEAANMIYEFENGSIYDVGDNVMESVSLTGASGGKAVSLMDAGDRVALEVNALYSGNYTLSIRYSQPYDSSGKYQNVIVNGESIGQLFCAYTGENEFFTADITANLK